MKDLSEILFIQMARLDSQRLPGKMLKPFAGTTLFEIAVQKYVDSTLIPNDQVLLNLHEPELQEVAKKFPVRVHNRSYESAHTESSAKLIHEYYTLPDFNRFKYIVYMNACTPFLSVDTLERFIEHYLSSPYPGLFGVMPKRNLFWDEEGRLITPLKLAHPDAPINTKCFGEVFEAAHCLYASQIDWLDNEKWVGSWVEPNDPALFPVEESEAFDIDYPWQFEMAESRYAQLHGGGQ